MLWAKRRTQSAVQHIGTMTTDGLGTFCDPRPIAPHNRHSWQFEERPHQFPDRRPCIRCVGRLIKLEVVAYDPIFNWMADVFAPGEAPFELERS